MSESSDSDSDSEVKMPSPTEMPEGLVEIFKSFMSREDYTGALEFVSDSYGFFPTPFVVHEILFKIMMNSEEDLAYSAKDYLECTLEIMPNYDFLKYNIIGALTQQSVSKKDPWEAFSHFVWSSLYRLLSQKTPETFHDHIEYVKSPNCDYLVEIYVKSFLKCPIKSAVLGSRVDERLSALLRWINLFYKFNIQMEPVLEHLHTLLDYIVDSEIAKDSSLPSSVKIHAANISNYIFLILKVCKDAFATPELQQRFFNNSSSPYLIMKICRYRLHKLIEKKALPQKPRMLTLKLIVTYYFFYHSKEDPENLKQSSTNSSSKTDNSSQKKRGTKLNTFSKAPIPGDTKFHELCRLGKPADLLSSLLAEQEIDVNIKNSVGNTPLHEACLSSSFFCCKFLMEQSGYMQIDYYATDNGGRIPLHCAVNVDAFDIVNYMLEKAGNDLVKCEDNWGKKPIDYSISDKMKKKLRKIESELEKHSKKESEDISSLKLPNLRKPEDLALFLRTLKTLVSNYCEIYGLPKNESDSAKSIRKLSHSSKECYHYKAKSNTSCTEDSSMLETFYDTVKKFISCVELITKDNSSVKRELAYWNTFAIAFK